jgi:hypothetical protein
VVSLSVHMEGRAFRVAHRPELSARGYGVMLQVVEPTPGFIAQKGHKRPKEFKTRTRRAVLCPRIRETPKERRIESFLAGTRARALTT